MTKTKPKNEPLDAVIAAINTQSNFEGIQDAVRGIMAARARLATELFQASDEDLAKTVQYYRGKASDDLNVAGQLASIELRKRQRMLELRLKEEASNGNK